MNIRLPRCILLGAALLLLATAVPAPARVIELQRHENREFHFAFQYPASWQLSPVTGGDLRARVSAPEGGPTAQCSVIVKQFPNAAEARQAEIDQVFLAPPTAAEIREMLGAEIPELEVLSVATTTLHTRPAHQAALRYPLPALVGTLPAYGRVVLTRGLLVHLGPGGDDHAILHLEEAGGGAVDADGLRAARGLYRICGDARAVSNVPDIDLLVRQDAGRFEKVDVDRA